MSHFATNWAVTQRGIKPAAKVVLWQLADRHNPDHGCFPRQEMLADDCEMSRSSLNEQLKVLERAGLIKRVTKRHPVTRRQEPTRYHFAFEPGFSEIVSDRETAGDADETEPSRVQNPDTETEPSRVQISGGAVSRFDPEPSPAVRTHIRSLTGKGTSKGTGKRAVRADRESIFEAIWKVFPLRPGSPQMDAWHIFEQLDEADLPSIQKGAERFGQWFREEAARKGEDFEEALRFAPYLVNWLKGQKWHDAKNLPVAAKPGTEAAEAMEGMETVNKWSHANLFAMCETVRGKICPVGKSGSWSFPKDVVDEARRRLGNSSGSGPP